MWRRMLKLSWTCVLLGAEAWPRVAFAQATPQEKAAAEAIFEEGLRLIKQGKFEEACPKFEMSQKVEPGIGTMLYLAECYEKTNRTASSWAMFREAASLAETSGQTERSKVAQARAARLESRLAWLNIEVSKEALVPGLQLKRNGVLLASELAGTPTPVDPGEVLVEASAPGRVSYSTRLTVQPKAHAVVTVPVLAPAAEAPLAVPPPQPAPHNELTAPAVVAEAPPPIHPGQPPPAATPAQRSSGSIAPVLVAGAGVVGLGVGSYFGLRAMSNASDARDGCPRGLCNEKSGQTAASDAHREAKISNVAFVLGGTLVAAGVVLYFALPAKTETQVGVSTSAAGPGVMLSLSRRLTL